MTLVNNKQILISKISTCAIKIANDSGIPANISKAERLYRNLSVSEAEFTKVDVDPNRDNGFVADIIFRQRKFCINNQRWLRADIEDVCLPRSYQLGAGTTFEEITNPGIYHSDKLGMAIVVNSDSDINVIFELIGYQFDKNEYSLNGDNEVFFNGSVVKGKIRIVRIKVKQDPEAPKVLTVNISGPETGIPSDGKTPMNFSVNVQDDQKENVKGQKVILQTSLGKLSATELSTDDEGNALASVTHNKNGVAEVTATVDDIVVTASGLFVGNKATAKIAAKDFTLSETQVIANGTTENTFTAVVKDGNGNLVQDAFVDFNIVGLDKPIVSITDVNGVATAKFASSKIGVVSVSATANNSTTPVKKFTFIADIATASINKDDVTVEDKIGDEDGYSDKVFTAIVKDANGNVVSDAEVEFNSSAGIFVQSKVKSNIDGVVSSVLTRDQMDDVEIKIVVIGNQHETVFMTNFNAVENK